MSRRFLPFTLILGPVCAIALPAASHGDEPSARQLHSQLQKTVRSLEACHLAVVTHTESIDAKGNVVYDKVSFHDMWVSGASAQVRMVDGGGAAMESWWENKSFQPLDAPLTTGTVEGKPGATVCVRPGNDIRWADFRRLRRAPMNLLQGRPTGMYTTSASLQRGMSVFVPLIEVDRDWMPRDMHGHWPVINEIASRPVTAWRIVGTEMLGEVKTVRVEVTDRDSPVAGDLKRYKGKLHLAPLWIMWCDPARGGIPLRIVDSMRYIYEGREYPLERDHGKVLYETSQVKALDDGLHFPEFGNEQGYTSEGGDPFDADKLVDSLLSDGCFKSRSKYSIASRQEWRVLHLSKIDPESKLWIDPPVGAIVNDKDTGNSRIHGKPKAAD